MIQSASLGSWIHYWGSGSGIPSQMMISILLSRKDTLYCWCYFCILIAKQLSYILCKKCMHIREVMSVHLSAYFISKTTEQQILMEYSIGKGGQACLILFLNNLMIKYRSMVVILWHMKKKRQRRCVCWCWWIMDGQKKIIDSQRSSFVVKFQKWLWRIKRKRNLSVNLPVFIDGHIQNIHWRYAVIKLFLIYRVFSTDSIVYAE